MFPVKAGTPLFSRPVATLALIAANMAIYFASAVGVDVRPDQAFRYGLVPRELFSRPGVTYLMIDDAPVAAVDIAAGETALLDPRLEGTTLGERLKRLPPDALKAPFRLPLSATRRGPFLGIPDSTVVVEPVSPGLSPWAAIFSSMFLHGGLLHLLGNMWFLWLFGPSVEDVLGRARFLAFYLLGGVAAAAAHVADDPTSLVPCVGASGAIAGVMGGYLVLFPRSEVLAVGPLILGGLIPLPAFIFLGFYLVEQIFMSMSARGGGVAWWAHIGGFVAGMIVVRSFRKTPEWEYALERRRPSGRRFGYDYPEARSEDGVGPFEDEDDPYRRRDDRLPTPRDFRR